MPELHDPFHQAVAHKMRANFGLRGLREEGVHMKRNGLRTMSKAGARRRKDD
jgi:hypothetical protein